MPPLLPGIFWSLCLPDVVMSRIPPAVLRTPPAVCSLELMEEVLAPLVLLC